MVDYNINQLYTKLLELQSDLANNMAAVAVCENKLELANPEQISKILLDINTLKHQYNTLNESIKQLGKSNEALHGKINQVLLDLSNERAEYKRLKEEETSKSTLFTKPMFREIIIGVLLSIILSIVGTVGKSAWDLFLDKQIQDRNQLIITPANGQEK